MIMRTQSRLWKSVLAAGVLVILAGFGAHTYSQDMSFILVGDVHFDKLTLHDMAWLQANQPNDVSQVNNYSQITQANHSAFMSELLHQSQIVTPGVAGIIQLGDLQEGLAGNYTLAAQMAREARDSLHALSFVPPWILTKGNHEVTGPGGAEAFNDVILPFVSSELNQSVTGTSYSYRIGDVQIIVIDSYDRGSLLQFLRSQLTSSTAKFKLIATHMPVIPVTARLWHLFQDDPANRDSLLNLIAMHKAIVLCGHLHKYSVVKRSTPFGPILQIMVGSVISNRDKHTPTYYVTEYGPSLVDLEPTYDTRTYLASEAQYVTDFRMAEMPGYAVLSLNSETGGRSLKFYAGLGEYLYETVNLSTYTLRVDTSGMGQVLITPKDSTFLAGTKVVVNAEPALGWKFDAWSGDLRGTTNPDTVTMDANKTVKASFSPIPAGQYEIRRTVVGSGVVVVEPEGPYYGSGTIVTLRARASSGSRFSGWGGDASGIDTVVTVTMNGHKSVTATFVKLKNYKLNLRQSQHGGVVLEPSAGTYVEGSQVLLRAQAEAGWEFLEWTGDVNGTTNPQSVIVDENKEIKAVFRKIGGVVQQLGATHDSYVQGSFSASRNFNSDSVLRVREGSSDLNRCRSFVQFDVSGVMGNVLGAVMKMRVRPAGLPDGKGIKSGVYAVSSDSWAESTLNWNGAPAAGVLLDSVTVSSVGMEYSWDIGTYVAAEVVGNKKVSVMVKDYAAMDRRIDFERREGGKGPVLMVLTDMPTGVKEDGTIPTQFALHQNYPNPFNPRTTIKYDLAGNADVSIEIFDILGRKVKRLLEEQQGPGSLSVAWDGKDDSEKPVESGIYLLRFRAGAFVENSKMILIK
jgi:3',5'-cyclic AMP phosphodiesterase CpdA